MRTWPRWLKGAQNSGPGSDLTDSSFSDDEQGLESQPTDSLLDRDRGSEKTNRRHPVRRCSWIASGAQYLILSTVLLANLVLLVLIFVGRLRIKLVDAPALPPRMSVDTVQIFHPETPFTIFSKDRGAAAWAQMTMNFDIGTVYVANHQEQGLFASELNSSVPGYENYAIAMYHQLHCLGTIRQEFYTLNVTAEAAYGQHIGHCFEYLRQSLICNADLTLEYTAVGWEVEHFCKDPKEVKAFMKKYNNGNEAYPVSD